MKECNDAEWVSESLAGSREAFALIVERYQSLICSIAYSATGDLSQSEDLAQETFLVAWKELRQLREPEKLRPWLCSIARSVISRASRRQTREPAHAAKPIEETTDKTPSPGPTPSEGAINREEEAILWRSLAVIPETYREPLILFYREGESVASVAEKLELSEDTVKQRLSRGRKLLTNEVTAFVAGMLKRTTPGKVFTFGVIAALPAFTVSAKAATISATTSKGAAVWLGWSGAIFGPLLGILGGLAGAMISIENTQSPRERRFMIKMALSVAGLVGIFCLAISGFDFAFRAWWKIHPLRIAAGFIGVLLVYGGALTFLIIWGNRTQRRIRVEESAKLPPGTMPADGTAFFAPFNVRSCEYRSHWMLFGLPLIHMRMGVQQNGRFLPAKGWIAVGETAYGALIALGGQFAVAPISMGGGGAIGILALGGGGAIGVIALGGGAAAGLLSIGGGLAFGMLALGGCAVGWTAALGGVAIAHDFAMGGAAFAKHTNDLAASTAIRNSAFYSKVQMFTGTSLLSLITFVDMVVLVLAVVAWWLIKKARAKRSHGDSK